MTDQSGAGQAEKIRALNDAFRKSFTGAGRRYVTAGISALSLQQQAAIMAKVVAFEAFEEGNDPYREHDFGAIDHAGQRIFWKIDYYDRACERGSEDPADESVTTRVLTVMLAEEY